MNTFICIVNNTFLCSYQENHDSHKYTMYVYKAKFEVLHAAGNWLVPVWRIVSSDAAMWRIVKKGRAKPVTV